MKTITIGPYDGDQVLVEVQDDATISDALRQAGLRLTEQQSVSSFSNAQDVTLNDVVQDGETYLLTSNHVSGI